MSEGNRPEERKLNIEITDDLTNMRIICDEMVKVLNNSPKKSWNRSIAITKLEEARMWLGEAVIRD